MLLNQDPHKNNKTKKSWLVCCCCCCCCCCCVCVCMCVCGCVHVCMHVKPASLLPSSLALLFLESSHGLSNNWQFFGINWTFSNGIRWLACVELPLRFFVVVTVTQFWGFKIRLQILLLNTNLAAQLEVLEAFPILCLLDTLSEDQSHQDCSHGVPSPLASRKERHRWISGRACLFQTPLGHLFEASLWFGQDCHVWAPELSRLAPAIAPNRSKQNAMEIMRKMTTYARGWT